MGTLTCHPDLYDEAGYNPPVGELSKPMDEKACPLTVLAERLVIGPPSIGSLIDLLVKSEYVQDFIELVREYLPEHETEIMQGDNDDRARRFCQLFEPRYFELDIDMIEGGDESLEQLVLCMPLRLQGMGYDDYHNFADRGDVFTLLLSLVADPWVEIENDDEGARVPLLEGVKDAVGQELAERIPEEGWSPGELHRRLDGTKYQAIAAFADWVWQSTELGLLDNSYEACEMPQWDRETVDEITEQAPKVREFWDNLNHIEDWLESSPQANFDELLSFIMREDEPKIPKEQLPLPLEAPKPKTLMEIFDEERLS